MSDRATRHWNRAQIADTIASAPRRATTHSERVGAILAGRFELTAHLGSGGMGSVYLARDRQLDEDVAVKVLHNSVAGADTLELLRREVKLARRVTSRNVARIHELIDDGGEWFLTMEFIDGVPLADMIAGSDERLPVARVIDILQTLCDGLEAVHRAGVIHGDVKPANIMVARDGRVVLSDFGIARFADTTGDTREVVGTPAYMAPEQVAGADLDPRADLYAVGVIAFELLSGELPFSGRNAIEVASARLIKDPPDLRAVCPEVSESLASAVTWLLARNPEARPATAAAAREALSSSSSAAPTALMSSVDIVDLYLKAQWLYRDFGRSQEAVELFARACRQAPASAMVHAGYALALTRKWMLVGRDTEGLAAAAKDAAARAMELGPQLGESQMARGSIALHLGEPVVAARAFRKAIVLAPGLADAHAIACTMLLEVDHLEEATARFEIARRLDTSLEQLAVMWANARALHDDWAGVDEVLSGDISPGTLTLMMVVRASAYRGDRAALTKLQAIARTGDTPVGLAATSLFNVLADVFLGERDLDEVEALLPADLEGMSLRRLAVTMQLRAELSATAGRIDRALSALEAGDRPGGLIDALWIDRCPLLDPLRGHERFEAVAARVRERARAVARALGVGGGETL